MAGSCGLHRAATGSRTWIQPSLQAATPWRHPAREGGPLAADLHSLGQPYMEGARAQGHIGRRGLAFF